MFNLFTIDSFVVDCLYIVVEHFVFLAMVIKAAFHVGICMPPFAMSIRLENLSDTVLFNIFVHASSGRFWSIELKVFTRTAVAEQLPA